VADVNLSPRFVSDSQINKIAQALCNDFLQRFNDGGVSDPPLTKEDVLNYFLEKLGARRARRQTTARFEMSLRVDRIDVQATEQAVQSISETNPIQATITTDSGETLTATADSGNVVPGTAFPTAAPTQSPTTPSPTATPTTSSPTSAFTTSPSASPTQSPSFSPTIAVSACSDVVRSSNDIECESSCDAETGLCTCAVLFDQIASGETCADKCGDAGMSCKARYSDGPRNGMECVHFTSRLFESSCFASGDSDGVCVCVKPVLGSHTTGCSTVAQSLGPTDPICASNCDNNNQCTCAFVKSEIPVGQSCDDVCSVSSMRCTARYAAESAPGRQCENFHTQTLPKSCSDTAYRSDVCVCSSP